MVDAEEIRRVAAKYPGVEVINIGDDFFEFEVYVKTENWDEDFVQAYSEHWDKAMRSLGWSTKCIESTGKVFDEVFVKENMLIRQCSAFRVSTVEPSDSFPIYAKFFTRPITKHRFTKDVSTYMLNVNTCRHGTLASAERSIRRAECYDDIFSITTVFTAAVAFNDISFEELMHDMYTSNKRCLEDKNGNLHTLKEVVKLIDNKRGNKK